VTLVRRANSSGERQHQGGAAGPRCPVCGGDGTPFRSAVEVGRDLRETIALHESTTEGLPLKLMHDEAVELAGCGICGTLWRIDPRLWSSAVSSYRSDRYDEATLATLHEDEVQLAERDAPWLIAQGVGPETRVLEVASYVGGFLAVASGLGASVLGVDPNPQLVTWCVERGLTAELATIEDLVPPEGAPSGAGASIDDLDGVWILNCFDQLPDPRGTLRAARRLLRVGGRLVIRTPNAAFVRAAYASGDPALRHAARRQVLWGLPHLCCYTVGGLCDLVQQVGFAVSSVRPRPTDVPTPGEEPAWFDLSALAC
jgi:SAM-dependent methyltransferase